MPDDMQELRAQIASLRDQMNALPYLLEKIRMFDRIDRDIQNLQALVVEAKWADVEQSGYVPKQHLEISLGCGIAYYSNRWFSPPKDEASARRTALNDLFYIEDGIAGLFKSIVRNRLPPSGFDTNFDVVLRLERFQEELRCHARKAIGGSLNKVCLTVANIQIASWIMHDLINGADSITRESEFDDESGSDD
jgi:hypothetical protein